MNPHTLAKALRRRQLRMGLADKNLIHAKDDMQILAAYLLCCKCNADIFENRAAAVENAKTPAEFLTLVNMALAAHRCQNRN